MPDVKLNSGSSYAAGNVEIRALASLDCGVGDVGSFAAIKNIVAT